MSKKWKNRKYFQFLGVKMEKINVLWDYSEYI